VSNEFSSEVFTDVMVRAAIEGLMKEYKEGPCPFGTVDLSPVPSIPTGSIALDEAIGVGGVPQGRITVIAGDPGSGKSTLSLHIIKSAQAIKPDCLNIYVDMEAGAYTGIYARNMGVDLDPNRFLPITPEYAEQGFEIIYRLISTGKVAVCVWDSIAGAYTKESANNSAEDNDSRGLLARLLSRQLPKLANKCGKTGTALVLVNQIRTQMTTQLSWKDITGGWAQKFYSSVRIDLSKEKERVYDGSVDRETITARISKNKVEVPYKMANFDIKLGQGILREANILDVAGAKGIIAAKGAGNYAFFDLTTGEEIAKARGRNKAVDYLVENPEYSAQLEQAILGYNRDTTYCVEDMTEEEMFPSEHIDEELDKPDPMILEDNLIALGL
jgi:recombination protein RecA